MNPDRPSAAGPVRIAAVGDLMLGDTAISVGYGFASTYPDGFDEAAVRIRQLLGEGDIVLGNLECGLSRRGYREDDWHAAQMRGHPVFAAGLRAAGFTHLSVANNHIMQHGPEAFEETVALLQAAGIVVCGLRGEGDWAIRPVRSLIRGRPITVLACSLRPSRFDREPVPYARVSPEQALADVARCDAAELVIVSLHWGEEYGDGASAAEVELGRALVNAGARLVVSHHPHVLRPIQRCRGSVVAYSLGNFISDMTWRRAFRETAVLRCELDDPAGTLSFDPAWIADDFMPVRQRRDISATDEIEGLEEAAYARQTLRTERQQSHAAYLHALRHIGRFHGRVLAQLVGTTMRNKLKALLGSG